MALEHFVLYIIIFLYGIVIGSFLNVCVFRIPKNENLVTVGSHCMECGHPLKWYDLIPLFSWLALRGKCRYCGSSLSLQYPVVEAVNGFLYLLVFAVNGWNWNSVLYCIMTSALLVISIIDYRTMLIPTAADLVILGVGVVHLALNWQNWPYWIIGLFSASAFLLICALLFRAVTGKGGLGVGDIELMACAGLCIGWGHALFAIVIGSVLGTVIEGVRILITKKKGRFPFGPYLSLGIFVSVLWGTRIYEWYMNTFVLVA